MLASLSSSCSNVSISSETASITASEFEYNASAIVTSMLICVIKERAANSEKLAMHDGMSCVPHLNAEELLRRLHLSN